MSDLSRFLHFIFDPIKAAAARAQVSSNPVTAAAGDEAVKALAPIQTPGAAVATGVAQAATIIAADLNAHKSPVGIINDVVGDAETALKVALDGFVAATVGGLPMVGGLLAPEAVNVANAALDFGTQHLLTYVAAVLSNHSAAINAKPPT